VKSPHLILIPLLNCQLGVSPEMFHPSPVFKKLPSSTQYDILSDGGTGKIIGLFNFIIITQMYYSIYNLERESQIVQNHHKTEGPSTNTLIKTLVHRTLIFFLNCI